jgi:hypothetical protein
MSQDPNLARSPDYYAARAVEERRLAMASGDPAVRAIHLEMAERYDELARSGGREPPEVIGGRERA